MKRLMMLKKRIKGQEFRSVALSLAKGAKNKGMSVRESTRLHALTGVPWDVINRYSNEGKT